MTPRTRCGFVSGLLGAAPAAASGLQLVSDFREYVETLEPSEPLCGTPMPLAYSLVLIAAPVCGLVSIPVGLMTRTVWRAGLSAAGHSDREP